MFPSRATDHTDRRPHQLTFKRLILSGDSDFAMYIGTGGPDGLGDIMLRNPEMKKRNGQISSFEIWTGQSKVVDHINRVLSTKRGAVFVKVPKYPIFDGVTSMRPVQFLLWHLVATHYLEVYINSDLRQLMK